MFNVKYFYVPPLGIGVAVYWLGDDILMIIHVNKQSRKEIYNIDSINIFKKILGEILWKFYI